MKNNPFPKALFIITLSLTGCSTLEVASLVTLAATGKGFGDHALSVVTGQDCHFFNVIQSERVCLIDNSAEMLLLTSEQNIDDSLKVSYSSSNAYLVIGSFSDQLRAESYQTKYKHWNSQVVLSDAKFRVVVGPVERQDGEQMKKNLMNDGIESPWLLTLSSRDQQINEKCAKILCKISS